MTEPMLASDEARNGSGVGPASAAMRLHRFACIGGPGAAAHDLAVNIADLPLPGVQMLLGADFLWAAAGVDFLRHGPAVVR